MTNMKAFLEDQAANMGDSGAADAMAERFISTPRVSQEIEKIKREHGENLVVVYITAQEVEGRNRIPAGLARALSNRLGVRYIPAIQQEVVGRTGA
ncbi:MAG: hypothetical protein HXY29_13865, partial [Rhodocyclaceae bacterium]|nr:hypothetical protein [Rhodocyclaceae bacterium]